MTTRPKKLDNALAATSKAFSDLGCDVGSADELLHVLQPHVVAAFNKHFTLLDAGAAAKELKPAVSKAEKLVALAIDLALPVAESASQQLTDFKRKVDEHSRRKAMNLSEDDVLPSEFKCPITQEKMTEPVTASDGHNYERAALEEHFRIRGRISPLTREHITAYFPNIDLRNRIQAHEGELLQLVAKAQGGNSSRASGSKKAKALPPSAAKQRKTAAVTAGKKRVAPSESESPPATKAKRAKSAKRSKKDDDAEWKEGDD